MLQFPGHIAIGYIFAKLTSLALGYGPLHSDLLLITLFSIFPDFDVIITPFYRISFWKHHDLPTHSLLFYIVTFLILYVAGFSLEMVLTLFSAILAHLLADSLGHGLMWFYPLSTRFYGLKWKKYTYKPLKEWLREYVKNPYTLGLELIIASLACSLAFLLGDVRFW